MADITIDNTECDTIRCLKCTRFCPGGVLKFQEGKIVAVDTDECTYCETCMDLCPYDCIKVE